MQNMQFTVLKVRKFLSYFNRRCLGCGAAYEVPGESCGFVFPVSHNQVLFGICRLTLPSGCFLVLTSTCIYHICCTWEVTDYGRILSFASYPCVPDMNTFECLGQKAHNT